MGQSLEVRFNGHGEEFVKYAREFGVGEAMVEYKIKEYTAALNYLEKKAPGEKFQYSKVKTDDFASPDAFDKFCESMLRKYSSLETALKTKDARIAELEKQVDYYKAGKWQETRPLVQGMMDYCKEE